MQILGAGLCVDRGVLSPDVGAATATRHHQGFGPFPRGSFTGVSVDARLGVSVFLFLPAADFQGARLAHLETAILRISGLPIRTPKKGIKVDASLVS